MLVHRRQLQRKYDLIIIGTGVEAWSSALDAQAQGYATLVLPFRLSEGVADVASIVDRDLVLPGWVPRSWAPATRLADRLSLTPDGTLSLPLARVPVGKGEGVWHTDYHEMLATLAECMSGDARKVRAVLRRLADVCWSVMDATATEARLCPTGWVANGRKVEATLALGPALGMSLAKFLSLDRTPRKLRAFLDTILRFETGRSTEEVSAVWGALLLLGPATLGAMRVPERDSVAAALGDELTKDALHVAADAVPGEVLIRDGSLVGVALDDGHHIRSEFCLLIDAGSNADMGRLFPSEESPSSLGYRHFSGNMSGLQKAPLLHGNGSMVTGEHGEASTRVTPDVPSAETLQSGIVTDFPLPSPPRDYSAIGLGLDPGVTVTTPAHSLRVVTGGTWSPRSLYARLKMCEAALDDLFAPEEPQRSASLFGSMMSFVGRGS